MINVIVADDEIPAVEEISYLLAQDSRIGEIHRATSGAAALKALEEFQVDAMFLDIHMPALSGLDIARVISRFSNPPVIVFVTADEAQALEAFELAAVDYILKPVRRERLYESVRRISEIVADSAPTKSDMVTVDQGGMTKMIPRSEIRFVQAQGDYVQLHTKDAKYLVRVTLNDLEEQWASRGFLRIHRSFLVSIDHVDHIRIRDGKATVAINGAEFPVSRRSLPSVRERLEATRVRPS
ncbi:LytR/AlgR family response regulator transcription factor [Neomicrococcus lactis]|uniref:DNA-binding LytR/AlgR family response regulator n=1 Tax=Neomicrococcus lactis TaxID=732241 RepID=A0A7W8YAS0_9MICC|nr:LytTR family DNA-binding domain-containing protein [Neomicrococcus lactis]MBB5598095.1 DNA-binding LytR/AlgR family response regulator [Neomicrococcus lactis]